MWFNHIKAESNRRKFALENFGGDYFGKIAFKKRLKKPNLRLDSVTDSA